MREVRPVSCLRFPIDTLVICLLHQSVLAEPFQPAGGSLELDAHLFCLLQIGGAGELFAHAAYQLVTVGIAAADDFVVGQEGEYVGAVSVKAFG